MNKVKLVLILWIFFVFVGCSSTKTSQISPDIPKPKSNLAQSTSTNSHNTPKIAQKSDLSGSTTNENVDANTEKNNLSENSENKEPQASDYDKGSQEGNDKIQHLVDSALEYYNLSQDLWNQGKDDEALQALDQAYELILQIDDDSELAQSKENLRFMIAKRILEIYASRYTVVNGLHSEIPLVMNRYVKAEIKRFQTSERKFFLEAYKRSGRYRPMIVKALKEAGLPEELSWLPLIESGFKVRALSRARALGLWQFIPSTGYKFGLKRNMWIDERLDPEKSTKAAIAYLKELHEIFGDWTTVLAAYNCGEGKVLRVIKRQKINYLDNFWDLYEKLPRETARYVPRFLAVLHILKDPAKYGFNKLPEPDPPLKYETVKVNKQYRLKDIAKAIGVSAKLLADYNPELRYKITPANYVLKVPKGKGPQLVALLEKGSIKPWVPRKTYYVYYRLRRGETLSHLARRYKTSVVAIMRINGISNPRRLRAGQRLKIPVGKKYVAYSSKRKKQKVITYIVKRGDSLWVIARKFKTSTKSIMRINNLKTHRLQVGQILKIPVRYSSS
ncbi:Lytic transglycosylase catalytic [Thermodesulfatator indicus DSM 15286]|uniref:Lytic transglycosylase catalytic n=1 Tax=Thermodesulfatator indicus (strain DSM 15286 / JCM 11887 / CIR29812) TaxID=667014 RepID=F8AD69_THEID|nr:LysM peptidoglycan-binding domain-containing protein [Thermodesulfatator indicus]AEH44801.1 Lytic transglycosylase catalytic [Thermodesulfatator indicus DSM 15286]